MTEHNPAASYSDPATDAVWLDGYRAALTDAIAMVDALGGPSFQNLSAPVLLRMKSRLIELQGRLLAA